MNPLAFVSILGVILVACLLALRWPIDGLKHAGYWPSSIAVRSRIKRHSAAIEIAVIVVWAIIVGREYLNPDPQAWPFGAEYGLSIQSQAVWQTFPRCGACVMWNGGLNGGAPAFVELQGAALHPLIVIGSLLFGTVGGTKLALVGSLIIAGLAQWWLARTLKLGGVARLWSACLVIVGGHLAGRMERGVSNIVLSTAACSLMLPPLIKLVTTGERRATLQLAVTSASAFLAGQGYLQIGVVLSYLPATLVLLVRSPQRPKGVWKELMLAALLAILLASVLIVPVLHFWPNFDKLVDPGLASVQALEYVPLNLVIRDVAFFQNEVLQKLPVFYFYSSYIGWVPILLALIGWRLIPRSSQRMLLFLLTALGLALLAASAVSLHWIQSFMPDFVATIRYPVFMAGLAVPIVLALAAWGLDRLLQQNWLSLRIRWRHGQTWQANLKWLALAFPLMGSIASAYDFSAPWLTTTSMRRQLQPIVDAVKTPTAQWVAFPFTESFWLPAALDANLKISPTYLPWQWKNRERPRPYVEATRDPSVATSAGYIQEMDALYILKRTTNEYAYVETGARSVPCRATAQGGDIDVDCQTDAAGTLIVRENSWTGWYASRDGQSIGLGSDPWLSAEAPAGQHHFEFRYRPWDVPIGFLLTAAGIGLTIWLWRHLPNTKQADTTIDGQTVGPVTLEL